MVLHMRNIELYILRITIIQSLGYRGFHSHIWRFPKLGIPLVIIQNYTRCLYWNLCYHSITGISIAMGDLFLDGLMMVDDELVSWMVDFRETGYPRETVETPHFYDEWWVFVVGLWLENPAQNNDWYTRFRGVPWISNDWNMVWWSSRIYNGALT